MRTELIRLQRVNYDFEIMSEKDQLRGGRRDLMHADTDIITLRCRAFSAIKTRKHVDYSRGDDYGRQLKAHI